MPPPHCTMNQPSPVIDRRGFLAMGLSALPALACAGSPMFGARNIAAPRKGPRKLKKAVGIGMIGGDASFADKMQMLRDLGFDGVELNRPGGPPVDEILKACDRSGIAIANVVDSLHWGKTLSDADPAVRKQGLDGLLAAIRDAHALHCKTVLLVPAVVQANVSYTDAYTRSQEEIRRALPLAEELGISVCIENVWNHFLLSPLEAARYVDELKSPAAGFHFDVGNIVTYGWPEHWIATLGHRIKNVHVKEYSRSKRDREGLWKGFDIDILDGDCNWPVVMKAFDQIGYEGWMVAEIQGGDRARLATVASRMDTIIAL